MDTLPATNYGEPASPDVERVSELARQLNAALLALGDSALACQSRTEAMGIATDGFCEECGRIERGRACQCWNDE